MTKEEKEVCEAKSGHVFRQWTDGEHAQIECEVVRGPASLCAYFGINAEHPLAGHNYELLPVQVHGGFTYGQKRKDGKWWYGWDYGHAGDKSTYDFDYDTGSSQDHFWTVDEVEEEIRDTIWDFEKLMNLSEQILLRLKRV